MRPKHTEFGDAFGAQVFDKLPEVNQTAADRAETILFFLHKNMEFNIFYTENSFFISKKVRHNAGIHSAENRKKEFARRSQLQK
jgi:hypothetical protein